MQAVPYRLIGASDIEVLERILWPAVNAWATAWFSLNQQASLTVTAEFDENISGEWLVFGKAPDSWIAWQMKPTSVRDYLRLMFDVNIGSGGQVGAISQDVIRECIADLFSRFQLEPALNVASCEPRRMPAELLRVERGRGAVICKLGWALPEQLIILGGEIAAALVSPARPYSGSSIKLVPRSKAIERGRVPVEVVLGKAELSISDILGMALGDVLLLDALYQTPVQASTSGKPLFRAKLGRAGEHKAVQVTDF